MSSRDARKRRRRAKDAVAPGTVFTPAPKDVKHIREGLEEAERGEGIVVSPEELKRWAETGEWPDSFD